MLTPYTPRRPGRRPHPRCRPATRGLLMVFRRTPLSSTRATDANKMTAVASSGATGTRRPGASGGCQGALGVKIITTAKAPRRWQVPCPHPPVLLVKSRERPLGLTTVVNLSPLLGYPTGLIPRTVTGSRRPVPGGDRRSRVTQEFVATSSRFGRIRTARRLSDSRPS